MDIFGSRNVAIVNLLGQGRGVIEAAEKDLRDLGITLTRLDARKVEAANDAWTRFGAVVKGLGQRFSVELSPYIKAAADSLVQWVKDAGGVQNIVADAMATATRGVGFLTDAFAALKVVAAGVEVTVLGIASAIVDVVQQWKNWKVSAGMNAGRMFGVPEEENRRLQQHRRRSFRPAVEAFHGNSVAGATAPHACFPGFARSSGGPRSV